MALRGITAKIVARPQLAAVAGIVIAVILGLGLWLLVFSGSDGSAPSSEVQAQETAPTPTATTMPTATPTPSPEPTATSAPAELEAYSSDSEPVTSGETRPDPGPASGSGMRMRIPRIGVDAPVTVRVVGSDGVMGDPNGRFDAVWYDFSALAGLGGYPGAGGNAVFAGHVDYHPNYEAVFWDLRLLVPGDIIEVILPDGAVVRYSVQWSEQISPEADFSAYARQTGDDIITIVTCQGTFNSATHSYDRRFVVRGIRVP
jgi:LPXTG-site transpeptidase (sortase) family protein